MHDRAFTDNVEAIEAWNTVLFDKFVRFRKLLTQGLGAHGDELLARFPVREGSHVLDVGCGFGDTTIALSRRVGPAGEAVGVDAAARFIDVARRDAAEASATRARFLVADVETQPLGGPYDRAYARFGTMFFASPVAALRNVRRSLAPGALFTMVVWRKKEDNEWLYEAERRVLGIVKPPETTNEPTCGPGPFSMASADVVTAQLKAAGLQRATLERFDTEIQIGSDVDEAVEFAMALGPAGEILRLAGDEGAKKKPEVVAALRDLAGTYARASGVFAPSSSWLVSAVAPGA